MMLWHALLLGVSGFAGVVAANPILKDFADPAGLFARQNAPVGATPGVAPQTGGPAPDPSIFGQGYGTSPSTLGWGLPCRNLQKRIEWRNLTSAQQASWISAVKCLTTKPAVITQGGLNPKPSRHYDDLPYTHADQAQKTHFVAQFLPWHRWFVWTHYYLLTQCGYSGPATYWDFELDYADPAHAPPFSPDPNTGFGGTGTGAPMNQGTSYAASVVQDGAFANWQLQWPTPHLLTRNFTTPRNGGPDAGFMGSNYYTPSAIASLLSNTVYQAFHVALEGTNVPFTRGTPQFRDGAHGGLHNGINGEMWHLTPINVAANDPMFQIFHGGTDKLWWKWQQADRARRFYASPTAYNGNAIKNQSANDAMITDVMSFNGLIPDVTTGSSINTELYPFCYTY